MQFLTQTSSCSIEIVAIFRPNLFDLKVYGLFLKKIRLAGGNKKKKIIGKFEEKNSKQKLQFFWFFFVFFLFVLK